MCLAQGPQRSDAGEVRTQGPSVSSQALYRWATVFPQDYSWIQDFEMLYWADYNSFSDLFSIHVKTIDHLDFKLLVFSRHTACLKIGISKVQDFENYELSPISWYWCFNSFFASRDLGIIPYMGLDATKPVFGVSEKARLKPVSSATETS